MYNAICKHVVANVAFVTEQVIFQIQWVPGFRMCTHFLILYLKKKKKTVDLPL